MNLGMFNKIYPNLKTRALIEERRFDMSISDKSNEIYVIPMHKKNVWTNKWMQDPRKNFLQVNYYDPSTQYKKGWGSFKRKRGLNLCYIWRRLGLRNALVENLVASIAKLWTMKFLISLE
jgi:hypothetical protein